MINYDQKIGAEKLYKKLVSKFCDAKYSMDNPFLKDMFDNIISLLTREMVDLNKEFDEFSSLQGKDVK